MKNNKLLVGGFFAFLAIISLITALIMSGNLEDDISQQRFRLTKQYKILKKAKYTFDVTVGARIYQNHCASCHSADGKGSMMAPPLALSDMVQNKPNKVLKIFAKGLSGAIQRQGKAYDSIMPSFKAIRSIDLAHVLNYIRTNFGNKATDIIHPVEVLKAKIDTLSHEGTFTEKDL